MRFLPALLLAASAGLFQGALAVTRITALGDSITGSPGCWRGLLWQQMVAAGYTSNDFDFVGTRSPDGCGFTYDGEHEGWGGYLATGIADQNLLVGWLAVSKPDVVMMHLGTNDVWSAKAPSVILAAFSKLVDQMRDSKPTMKILVAKIIPMSADTCGECYQRTIEFNAAIEAWAPTKSTSTSPITVVDQWTGFNTVTDTYDGVHPNNNGNIKIAAKWYPYIASVLGGSTPPVTSTTTTTSTPTSTSKTTSSTSTTKTSTTVVTPTPTGTGPVVGAWGQCGGVSWTGGTTCTSGYTCKYSNPYYSQCLPN